MELLFFCPRWGKEHLLWNDFLIKVKEAGYDGVEAAHPPDEREKDLMLNSLHKYGLRLIGQHWETVTPDFTKHCEEYTNRIHKLTLLHPLFINSQTGKDYFSFDENKQLIQLATAISNESGIATYHETHRGKFSFASHITMHYLQQIKDLWLTLDISHWCSVAETLLHDQQDAVEMAVSRTNHLHARVGHTQGAQVTDPRAPECSEALEFHLACWDRIIEFQKKKNTATFTITCEFGPFPYMARLPFTDKPISDQWEVNLFMKDLLKRRYCSLEPVGGSL
jgi:sugar phosphate isomerase/epimerase